MFISPLVSDENTVGHFQVHFSLYFKMRLCKAFVKKMRFQNRTNCHNNNFAHNLAFFWHYLKSNVLTFSILKLSTTLQNKKAKNNDSDLTNELIER